MQKKIIVALDGSDEKKLVAMMDMLDPQLCRLKIGKEAFTYFGPKIVETAHKKGYEVFLDLKIHDLPEVVHANIKAVSSLGAWMTSIHLSGGMEMIKAAKQAISESTHKPLLVGVTVLSSLSDEILQKLGFPSVNHLVLQMGKIATGLNIDGVIATMMEVPLIKSISPKMLCITPGIKLDHSDPDINKVTTKEAIEMGSDYVIIGKGVTHATDPLQVLKSLG